MEETDGTGRRFNDNSWEGRRCSLMQKKGRKKKRLISMKCVAWPLCSGDLQRRNDSGVDLRVLYLFSPSLLSSDESFVNKLVLKVGSFE